MKQENKHKEDIGNGNGNDNVRGVYVPKALVGYREIREDVREAYRGSQMGLVLENKD